jgi:predicted MFS family arabinose efflux permease
MRDRPSDMGLMPYGETGEPKPAPTVTGNPVAIAFRTLAEAVRIRDFWLLAGTFFICGASTNGLIGTHLIPACMDVGIGEVAAASVLATIGVFNFIGTTGSGWLSDRYDNRKLLCIYYALRGVSLLFLPFSFFTFYGLSLFAVFYGLDWFATVSPTVRLIAQRFGRDKAGIVYGWVFATHQLGGASAAFFGGLLRETNGSYMEAFMISGLLCFIAAIMVLFIGGERAAPQPAAPAAAKAA